MKFLGQIFKACIALIILFSFSLGFFLLSANLMNVFLFHLSTPIPFPVTDAVVTPQLIMYWVYENIEYPEGVENWGLRSGFNPSQTSPQSILRKGEGICIERALLTCSFLKYHGFECYFKNFFVVRNDFNFAGHVYPCTIIEGEEFCVDEFI